MFHHISIKGRAARKGIFRGQPNDNAEDESPELRSDAGHDGSLVGHEDRIFQRITDRQKPV